MQMVSSLGKRKRSEQPHEHTPRHTKHWCKTHGIVGFLDGHLIASPNVSFRHTERGRTRRRLAVRNRIFIILVSRPLTPWVLRDNVLRRFKGYMCCKLGDTSLCFVWIFANLKDIVNTPLKTGNLGSLHHTYCCNTALQFLDRLSQ